VTGQRIIYKYVKGGLNDYLGGATYPLPGGGKLGRAPQGTVVSIR
jgi:hypothetical protein